MSDQIFDLNRPVHLARRDVFYEQATRLIQEFPAKKNLEEKKEVAENALRFFCSARKHARAAGRSDKTSPGDQLFLDFLDPVVDNTQSLHQMLHRQQSAEEDLCPLGSFLNLSDINAKMAAHYRRCANHALKGILLILQHAAKSHEKLREDTLIKMSPSDKTRYEKARAHLSDTLQS